MGFFKSLSNKVESWLMKDEIKEYNNHQKNVQLSPSQLEQLNKVNELIRERNKYIDDQMTIITSEDHSIKPTQSDINRYFVYHTNYIGALEFNKVWSSSTLLNEDDYKSRGRVEGWDFLRESCGLPSGILNPDKEKTWNTK